MAFLIEATRWLGDSLALAPMPKALARLSLPHLGSWCVVDLLEGDRMHRLAIIHPDPVMERLAEELLADGPPQRDDPLGIPSAMRTRRSEIVFPVTDERLVVAAGSAENLAILRISRSVPHDGTARRAHRGAGGDQLRQSRPWRCLFTRGPGARGGTRRPPRGRGRARVGGSSYVAPAGTSVLREQEVRISW